MKYIVELEEGVWLSVCRKNPGRVLNQENAKRFMRRAGAEIAIMWAGCYLPCVNAKIVEVDE